MKYTRLTKTERYHIDDMLREGFLESEIAANVSRSASTLSRELRRKSAVGRPNKPKSLLVKGFINGEYQTYQRYQEMLGSIQKTSFRPSNGALSKLQVF